MRPAHILLFTCAVSLAVPSAAQLLPGVNLPQLPPVGAAVQGAERALDGPVQAVSGSAEQLVQARNDRRARRIARALVSAPVFVDHRPSNPPPAWRRRTY